MNCPHPDEEHDLPCIEAVLAGVLALMTGYSQSLLADQPPDQRLAMGTRIAGHLWALADHPQLSPEFRTVLGNLHRRWDGMCLCSAREPTGQAPRETAPAIRLHAAPGRLQ